MCRLQRLVAMVDCKSVCRGLLIMVNSVRSVVVVSCDVGVSFVSKGFGEVFVSTVEKVKSRAICPSSVQPTSWSGRSRLPAQSVIKADKWALDSSSILHALLSQALVPPTDRD